MPGLDFLLLSQDYVSMALPTQEISVLLSMEWFLLVVPVDDGQIIRPSGTTDCRHRQLFLAFDGEHVRFLASVFFFNF